MLRLSRLEANIQETILKSFVNDLTATQTSKMSGINRNTANKWYRIFRELIVESQKVKPRFHGFIELDQAFFGRKRRQKRKKKMTQHGLNYGLMGVGYKSGYNKQKAEDLIQTLGIIQRRPKGKSLVYTHIIKDAKEKSIMPVIHLIVDKATILTDAHASLSNIKMSGYKHKIINKSTRKPYKDLSDKEWDKTLRKLNKAKGWTNPTAKIHTNTIESFWGFAKLRLSQFKGISRETLPLHIKESEFRWNNKDLMGAMKRLIAGGQY